MGTKFDQKDIFKIEKENEKKDASPETYTRPVPTNDQTNSYNNFGF